jgi:putative PIN family toxin of toxin-antitoxin system
MTRERVVVDTNVLISGLLSSTPTPARAVEHAIQTAQLVASRETLRELFTTLLAARFDRYVSRERRERLLLRLISLVEIAVIVQEIRACRDPDDDKFLEAAVNGRADVLVSGDDDLLVLHPFREIAILSAAEYLKRNAPAAP